MGGTRVIISSFPVRGPFRGSSRTRHPLSPSQWTQSARGHPCPGASVSWDTSDQPWIRVPSAHEGCRFLPLSQALQRKSWAGLQWCCSPPPALRPQLSDTRPRTDTPPHLQRRWCEKWCAGVLPGLSPLPFPPSDILCTLLFIQVPTTKPKSSRRTGSGSSGSPLCPPH